MRFIQTLYIEIQCDVRESNRGQPLGKQIRCAVSVIIPPFNTTVTNEHLFLTILVGQL